MTTLIPREPYNQQELTKLYPKQLDLYLVQVLLRHGERVPVSVRFQNAGLPAYWPYCNAAKRMRSVAMTPEDTSEWNSLQWRRRLEQFGEDDGPIIASGPRGEVDGICQLGELTDRGRETTYALGQRLRHLYVDQLQFMPSLIKDADMIYLRATPLPRALESVQQTFWGMYPLTARTAAFPPPTIVTRTPADETLFPNEGNCRRFAQLARAFAQRTGDRWNESDDMKYLTKQIGKWMPESSPKVAVDSHPRLSGVMDTINSTLSHGPETMLPKEFYDKKAAAIIDKVAVEEWFSGFQESREYRQVGIGGLMGDIVERMVSKVEHTGLTLREIGGENGKLGLGRGGENAIRFAMSGCHDTTLAALLAAVGAFEGEKWPPYTSHLAFELFKRSGTDEPDQFNKESKNIFASSSRSDDTPPVSQSRPGRIASMLGLRSPAKPSDGSGADAKSPNSISVPGAEAAGIARRPWASLSDPEKEKLSGYYVRIRFNDKVMKIPACAKPGNNWEGDDSICTLEAFKRVADGFTPKSWKGSCGMNLDKSVPALNAENPRPEWAGQIEVDC